MSKSGTCGVPILLCRVAEGCTGKPYCRLWGAHTSVQTCNTSCWKDTTTLQILQHFLCHCTLDHFTERGVFLGKRRCLCLAVPEISGSHTAKCLFPSVLGVSWCGAAFGLQQWRICLMSVSGLPPPWKWAVNLNGSYHSDISLWMNKSDGFRYHPAASREKVYPRLTPWWLKSHPSTWPQSYCHHGVCH